MTTNGYKVSGTEQTRGPIKAGFFADLIAVPGNPLDNIDALKQVQFVMKDGQVFKRGRRHDTGGVLPRRPGQRLADPVSWNDMNDANDGNDGERRERPARGRTGA